MLAGTLVKTCPTMLLPVISINIFRRGSSLRPQEFRERVDYPGAYHNVNCELFIELPVVRVSAWRIYQQ